LIHVKARRPIGDILRPAIEETMMRKLGIVAALAMAALVASAGAQPLGTAPGGSGYGNGMGPWMMAYGHWGRWLGWGTAGTQLCADMVSRVEGRLAYVKAELKISAAQEGLWAAYAETARNNAQTLSARCAAMLDERAQALALPDRLDLREQLMAARLDAMRASGKALKPLYSALDDRQKQIADRLFWTPIGRAGVMGML
jgi:hypothetical protein